MINAENDFYFYFFGFHIDTYFVFMHFIFVIKKLEIFPIECVMGPSRPLVQLRKQGKQHRKEQEPTQTD